MTTFEWSELDQRAVDTARVLAARAGAHVDRGRLAPGVDLHSRLGLERERLSRGLPVIVTSCHMLFLC